MKIKVIEGRPGAFQEDVNALLDQGWQPYTDDGVHIREEGSGFIYTMVLRSPLVFNPTPIMSKPVDHES